MAMTLVSTTTVGAGGAASIEFTGIAGTGKDLLVLISSRTNYAFSPDTIQMEFNNTTTNFSNRILQGTGSGRSAGTNTPTARSAGYTVGTDWTANTFSSTSIYVLNYASSTNKTYSIDVVTENNATSSRQGIIAGAWANTAAITGLKFTPENGTNFAQHTTASLYIIS